MAHDEPVGEQGTPSGLLAGRRSCVRRGSPSLPGSDVTLCVVEREYRDELPISDVHGHPHNVREDLGDLTELVKSIREIGILEPLVVAPAGDGDGFVAIAGNRRRAAAVLAGLRVVPAIIRTGLSEQQVYQAMLVENLHRAGLTPMEEAKALKGLKDSGLTLKEIASKIGKSDAFVHDRIILNELPEEIRRRVMTHDLRITRAVQMARQLAGRSPDKVDRGWDQPHFAKSHPLWPQAYRRCSEAEHGLRRRIAGVCGACWEATIRVDARAGVRPVVQVEPSWRARPAPYDPIVGLSQERDPVVTRAQDLAELHALAGGVRETVMTATPERVRRLLERAFKRLTESVAKQQAADARERRSIVQAVEDLTDVFTDDTTVQPTAANG